MADTAQTIINQAMKRLGVLSQGETPSSEEADDALESLNTMLDSWSTERLGVFDVTETIHTMTVAQAQYTVGSGGDIAITRPLQILRAFIRDNASNPIDYPVRLLNQAEWNRIPSKLTNSTYPVNLFYDAEFPLGIINLWPVPSAAFKLVFNSVNQLTELTDLATSFSMPPGYKRAVIYNLAVEMAPDFGVQPSRQVFDIADESKANIKRLKILPEVATFDLKRIRGRGRYNIFSDI